MGKCILVVDDDQEIRMTLRSRLMRQGYTVECSATGKEAINYFVSRYYEQAFDVVLLDIELPDINGCDVLKMIRQEEELRGLNYESGVRIIMQTGLKELWMEAFNRGCDDYIIKPYSFDVLTEKINTKLVENEK